jgi:Tfp pilus assembly protein PilX
MKKASQDKGQSLVEVIMALAVALLVVVALVRATVTSIRNARFAKDKALATKYAQEGIEAVRAYRDGVDWSTFISGCSSPPGLSDPPASFTRKINCSGSDDSKRDVTVTVSWSDASGDHESKLETSLTNWK